MISGINHITFAVSDLKRSLYFYRDVLGATEVYTWASGSYLDAGGLWLCLSLDPRACGGEDYSHIAFSCDTGDFSEISARIRAAGAKVWKENRSEGESLYFCCPDGHRLELHVGDMASRLNAIKRAQRSGCGDSS